MIKNPGAILLYMYNAWRATTFMLATLELVNSVLKNSLCTVRTPNSVNILSSYGKYVV